MSVHLISIVAEYLNALQNRTSSADLDVFYHPDVIQVEYPNAFTKNLTERDLSLLKAASDRGLKVLQKEVYEIIRSYCSGNTVIAEVVWRGTLNVQLGTIPIGGEMVAYFAQFYEFEGDRIIRQRSYDCFEPFS